MAFVMGNATVPASSTVPLFTVPPSSAAVTFYNLNTAATVYLGLSSAGTSVNGFQCHSIPTSFQTFVGGKGATFWGTTGSSTAASVQFIVVTDF